MSRQVALLGVSIASLSLLLSACSDDPANSKPAPSTTTGASTTTTGAPVPSTTFPPAEAEAIRDEVIDYQQNLGIGASFFDVRNFLLSSTDPSWARFNVAPTPGNETVVEYGYGVAHWDGSLWAVVDYGTVDVGCARDTVPERVRQSLQLDCASS
jgi:hypothetical protein